MSKIRALALFSGGLDSLLAMKLLIEQGIEVIGLYFDTGFGGKGDKEKKRYLQEIAKKIGAKLEIIDIKEQFIQEILFDPKYGYGKNFNPCIDCHANMIRVAKALLPKYDAHFIISGEVVGQRPMSQRFDALKKVENLSTADGLILRPLSAKLLPPTIPEQKGWVDREKLLDISGRSREVQMRLAKEWGIENYESPAGGCLLTDEHFSKKIKDHIAHDTFSPEDADVLKWGRHFRLPYGAKLVVSRNKEENEKIQSLQLSKYERFSLPLPGPLSLVSKNANTADKELAAKIALTYSKAQPQEVYEVKIGDEVYIVSPFPNKSEAQRYLIK
ncbi:tRNA-uridine 2-sulfurtransferase [Nitratiruptor sp. YY08-26]|uniref:argininosuccinate synthase domain-containing protein n=1 Tax=unclassified Nitratiruptor TaxID=2624044 RepID=UPI0019152B3B|nr:MULTISPECIES: argininosuccinate synthase domain-containing protein [unclassified Nitratiruptor]BCD61401.1 tRNA-uridine 2-sulfurtransferase [Nitratiruptor sp. YY08-13]BCD65335.1 tRNA-uridine 2-sulfurtransferase [Nitratiruptor sp. YY08-26]